MDIRDTVIKIDLSAISHNIKTIHELIGADVAILAVIKANAYGHGAVQVAKTFMDAGVTYLGVATLSEAIELRNVYPDCPIFILGHTPDRFADIVVKNRFTQTVIDYGQALALSESALRAGTAAKVHLKVETGLVRLGMRDPDEAIRICALPGLEVEGLFSHLALAGAENDNMQWRRLSDFSDAMRNSGINFRYIHIADSVATVDRPEFRSNMVRPGSLCFGMHSWESDAFVDVRQSIRFETRVTQVHVLKPGEGAGYEYHWIAPGPGRSLIATLPFGYCDGYPRRLYERGYVTIRGKKCPFAGLIGMDQCMVDATAVPDVKQGDRVIIYGDGDGDGMSLQEAADLCGTFKNDIIARLTVRPPREYIHKQPYASPQKK